MQGFHLRASKSVRYCSPVVTARLSLLDAERIGLNPLQPKPAFSSLDHVFLAPAAEFWAVRSGSPVSAALACSAALQVSSPRASADRYVVGCEFLDLTFCFSFIGISVVGKLLQTVNLI